MKKFLVGALMLVPLIIICCVLLTTNIISVNADIMVNEIKLTEHEVNLTGLQSEPYKLEYKLYPTSSTNKKIHWSIPKDSSVKFDSNFEGDIATVDGEGNVYINTYGVFYVVAKADDGGATDKCLFRVSGDMAESVDITYKGEIIDKLNIKEGDIFALSAIANPIDALLETSDWISSNEKIVTVDDNGIITAKGVGTANVTVKVKSPDKSTANGVRVADDVQKTIKINVSKGAFKYNEFYTSKDSINLASFSNGDCVINNEETKATIENGVLNLNGEKSVIIESNGQKIAVIKCNENDITIENAGFLKGRIIKVGKLPVYLNCIFRETGRSDFPKNIVFSSSNPSVATIDNNGMIKAIKTGIVDFTAESGGKSVNIQFEVQKPVTHIILGDSRVKNLDKGGIANVRYFGNYEYDSNGELINTRQLTVKEPNDVENSEFEWYSSNENIAKINSNGLITFNKNIEGRKKVTITVVAKNSPYASVRVYRKYTFDVSNGVNVFNKQEITKAANDKIEIYMQSDICFNNETSRGWFVPLYKSLYGNGHKLSYRNADLKDMTGADIVSIRDSNVTLSNVVIHSGTEPAGSMFDKNNYKYRGIEIYKENGKYTDLENVKVEYSRIEFAHFGIVIYGGEVEIDGCVIRNVSNYGIYVHTSYRGFEDESYSSNSYVTIKNCILAKSPIPLIGASTYSDELTGHTTLNFEGFCEIYNWQKVINLDIVDNITGEEAIDNMIRKVVAEEMSNKRWEPYEKVKNGQKYFNLTLLAAGLQYKSNIDFTGNYEANGFSKVRFKLGDISPLLAGFDDCYVLTYDKNSKIEVDSTYTLNEETYARLRGEI